MFPELIDRDRKECSLKHCLKRTGIICFIFVKTINSRAEVVND